MGINRLHIPHPPVNRVGRDHHQSAVEIAIKCLRIIFELIHGKLEIIRILKIFFRRSVHKSIIFVYLCRVNKVRMRI